LSPICLICRDNENQQLISICNICRNAYYHKNCLDEWFKVDVINNRKCPLCQKNINIKVTYKENIEITEVLFIFYCIIVSSLIILLLFYIINVHYMLFISFCSISIFGLIIMVYFLYNTIVSITRSGWSGIKLSYDYKIMIQDTNNV